MAFPSRALRLSFCALVALLAVFQFSENTADPDLWGHVAFGRQILQSKSVPRREIYSWTARGQLWINHEWVAEIALGGAYLLAGGTGILLLKMAVGLLTFTICIRLGTNELTWPKRYVAWVIGALAVVELSYGFAARPQIFTALCLAIELFLLRKINDGKSWWAVALPFLFVFWINAHGGALIGFGVLGLAAIATTGQNLRNASQRSVVIALWLTVIGSAGALLCNPWGVNLLRWLTESMLWMRPEIQEWHATPFGWDHAAFFLLIAVGVFGWFFSRLARRWWEVAVWTVFVGLGIAATRNAPLFAIISLAILPKHVADGLIRFKDHFVGLESLGTAPGFQSTVSIVCGIGTIGMAIGTFGLHKQHPLTMEVPESQYPVSAINFMRLHSLKGNLLIFFDWGEEAIFVLPGCPPSIDGRLDTCYSRALIAGHWKFYNADPVDPNVLNINGADLALLPSNLAGSAALAKTPNWRVVYYDNLAVVLVRDLPRFPSLRLLNLPIAGSPDKSGNRAVFPGN